MFCYLSHNNKYENYWIIEEDVFIPTVDTIHNIDSKYQTNDILCTNKHEKSTSDFSGWEHWWQMKFKNKHAFELPWFKSMVCAIRLPNEFFIHCASNVLKNKRLFFIEFFILTLAHKHNINCIAITELQEIHWRRNFKICDFKAYFINIYIRKCYCYF